MLPRRDRKFREVSPNMADYPWWNCTAPECDLKLSFGGLGDNTKSIQSGKDPRLPYLEVNGLCTAHCGVLLFATRTLSRSCAERADLLRCAHRGDRHMGGCHNMFRVLAILHLLLLSQVTKVQVRREIPHTTHVLVRLFAPRRQQVRIFALLACGVRAVRVRVPGRADVGAGGRVVPRLALLL